MVVELVSMPEPVSISPLGGMVFALIIGCSCGLSWGFLSGQPMRTTLANALAGGAGSILFSVVLPMYGFGPRSFSGAIVFAAVGALSAIFLLSLIFKVANS